MESQLAVVLLAGAAFAGDRDGRVRTPHGSGGNLPGVNALISFTLDF